MNPSMAARPQWLPKPSITDEPLDAWVNRPLASWIVRAVLDTHVTPNQLSVLSALLGSLAGFCFAIGRESSIFGAAALFLCMIVDCSDGQLARARGGGTNLGRIIDGYADYWVAFSLHLGILLHIGREGTVLFGHALGPVARFFLVLAAGTSMALNAARFDFYKWRYLAYTGEVRNETPEQYLEEAEKTRSRILRVLLLLFAAYVRAQQGASFHAQAMAARRFASDPDNVARFVEKQGPLVRLWRWSGPTMHNAAICATGALAPFVKNAFVGYLLFALVVVNAYGLVISLLQRRHLVP